MKKLLSLIITVFSLPLLYGKNDSIRAEDIKYLQPFINKTALVKVVGDSEIAAVIRVCEKSSNLVVAKTLDCAAIGEILINSHNELSKNKNIPHDALERIMESAVQIKARDILDRLEQQMKTNRSL